MLPDSSRFGSIVALLAKIIRKGFKVFSQLSAPLWLTQGIACVAVVVGLLLHAGHQLDTCSPNGEVAGFLSSQRVLAEVGNDDCAKLMAAGDLETCNRFGVGNLGATVAAEGNGTAFPERLNQLQHRQIIVAQTDSEKGCWMSVSLALLQQTQREVSLSIRKAREPVPEGVTVYVGGEWHDSIDGSHDRTPIAKVVRAVSRLPGRDRLVSL